MMHGRNNGKKLMAVRIVKHTLDIINLLTDSNPIQVVVDAIINSGPREDSTRIGSQGTVRRQAVDVSPLRRVNQSIALLTTGVCYNNNYYMQQLLYATIAICNNRYI
jgi:small subunit ribosomal protein S5e